MKTGEGSSQTAPDARLEGQQRMEAVWRDRAIRLAKRPVLEEAGQNAWPVIVLRIGDERFGIDLKDVAEILPPVRATPVPGAAVVFAGVVNVHGEIRPVIDLRRLLSIETPRNGETEDNGDPARVVLLRVVLLRKEGRELGLQVDGVERISSIGPGDLESAENSDTGLSQGLARGLSQGLSQGATPQHISSKYVRRSTKDLLMLLSTEALFAELDT
jgi:purine-binding chemotaxis protein CheW